MLNEDDNDTEVWGDPALLSIYELKSYQEKRINGTGRKKECGVQSSGEALWMGVRPCRSCTAEARAR